MPPSRNPVHKNHVVEDLYAVGSHARSRLLRAKILPDFAFPHHILIPTMAEEVAQKLSAIAIVCARTATHAAAAEKEVLGFGAADAPQAVCAVSQFSGQRYREVAPTIESRPGRARRRRPEERSAEGFEDDVGTMSTTHGSCSSEAKLVHGEGPARHCAGGGDG